MRVAFDETRDDHLAGKIHDSGFGTPHSHDVIGGTDGLNRAVAHGHRLANCPRVIVECMHIERHDNRVRVNRIWPGHDLSR